MSTSILGCFEHECPVYPGTHGTYKAAPSSEGTKKQAPPRVLVQANLSEWVQLADAALQAERAKKQGSKLFQKSIACDEEALAKLHVEQDVVRVSGLFITHPVQCALNARYNAAITIATETKQDKFRFDFSFNINQDTAQKQRIAIIEYKRIGTINYNDFADCTVPAHRKVEMRDHLNKIRRETVLNEATSGWVLSKQAAAYAFSSQCFFVALCDYDSLVLLEFESLDYVRVTTIPRPYIRKALLGFCIKACDCAGLKAR